MKSLFNKISRWTTTSAVCLIIMVTVRADTTAAPLTEQSHNNMATPTAASKPRPHIVFVMADDLGYNDIGYHNAEIKSPFLDALSARGVRLENYYVQPRCSPSRSQLMSGRYQIHTGMQHKIIWPEQPNGLPLDSPTLADKLKEAGYSTHMIGKWHLGFYKEEYLPTRRGFETFFGIYTGSSDHYTYVKCAGSFCGFDLHNDTATTFNTVRVDSTRPRQAYSTHLFSQKAVDIIKKQPRDKPLFLFLSYTAPHSPMQVPKRFFKMNRHISKSRKRGIRRRRFAAMVTALDEGVSRVVRSLKSQGMWNNTVFIFSSDNGGKGRFGGSNLPLRGEKGTLWEGGVRAVGFVASPLLAMTNYSNQHLMHISDWYPTLVRLAGGNLSDTKPLDGLDQWDTIRRNSTTARTVLLHNIDPLSTVPGRRIKRQKFDTRVRAAIRVGDYKLITGLTGKPRARLYNIKEDPGERNNLARRLRGKMNRLLDLLQTYQEGSAEPFYPPKDLSNGPRRTFKWGPWM